jgi:thioredoxin-related protein
MKIKILFIFCFLIFACITVKAGEINWKTNLKEAKKIAQKTGKPLLLDFTAKWCGPCRRMERDFWVKREVIELSNKFVCVKIDYDQNLDLRKQYRVRGIPFVVLTDSWGIELNSHVGYLPAFSDEIINKFELIPKDFSEIIEAGNLLENQKNDLPALAKIAEFYQRRNFFDQSNNFYTQMLELEKNPEQREVLLLNIGFNYLGMTIPIEAEKIFKQIQIEFSESKNRDMAIYGEIYALVQKGRLNSAKRLFEKLKTDFPRSLMLSKANQIISDEELRRN